MSALSFRRLLALFALLASFVPMAQAAGPILTVSGPSAARKDFDLAALDALPQLEVRTTNPWVKAPVTYRGPLLRTVLEAASAKGQQVKATALNDYRIQLPVDDAMKYDVILATRANGQVLSVRDKGPIFVVYPFDARPELKHSAYYERSIWQVRSLQVD